MRTDRTTPACTTPVAADSIPASASELHKLRESRCHARLSPGEQAPAVKGLEGDRVSPCRERAFASRVQDPLGLQVGQVEELLQLGGGEGSFLWPGVISLNVTRPVELGDDLTEHGAKQSPAVLISVVSRIGGVIEEQLHIGLVGAHRRMGEVTNTAKVTEEIIGIGSRPLPRIRTDEVAHPAPTPLGAAPCRARSSAPA